MASDTVEKMKKGKPFRPADLIVYGALVLVVAGLFIAFVFTRTSATVTAVYADCDGRRVFSYVFAGNGLEIFPEFENRLSVNEDGEKLTLTFYADAEKKDYNLIVIEKAGKVYVSDANCSARRDCVRMSPIADESGVIVCVPHKLKIYASGDMNPSLG